MRVIGLAVLCAALALEAPAVIRAQTNQPAERFTAFAVNMSNIAAGANARVEIVITRWSTEAERTQLLGTFAEQGPKALLSALQKTPKVGYFKLPNVLGYDLRFARQLPLEDGGRRIVIVTDRRISFKEAEEQPRTMDYPFTLIELRLKKDGTGEGKMSLATKITLDKKDNVIQLENYSSEPVRLTNVKPDNK